MLKNRFIAAIITCVTITLLCGCESANEEIAGIISYYSSELRAQGAEIKAEGEAAGKETSEKEEELIEVPEIYYAYHLLNDEERKLYLEVLSALQNMSDYVDVSTLDSSQLDRIFECVQRDHPELFYVEGFKYTEHFLAGTLKKISFKGIYSATKQEAELAAAEIEAKLSECNVFGNVQSPPNGDEYSVVKQLYDYLIGNTEYDADAENNQNIRSVFLGGRSVCQGYAKAMQYMLQKAGIQAFLVTGYAGGDRHAWNLARVNGRYYYLDPTWGDASYSYSGSEGNASNASNAGNASIAGMEEAEFAPPINYDYFLVTEGEISKTHSFEAFMELPTCDSTQDNYYVREGLFFESYDRERLENIFAGNAVKMADYATIKCADSEVYAGMMHALIDERQIFSIIGINEGSISYSPNDELCTISFWNIF